MIYSDILMIMNLMIFEISAQWLGEGRTRWELGWNQAECELRIAGRWCVIVFFCLLLPLSKFLHRKNFLKYVRHRNEGQ